MGLEAGTFINDLVTSNPLGSDGKSQGDDHLRLIKTTVKNTFPGAIGALLIQNIEAGAGLNDNDRFKMLRNSASPIALDLLNSYEMLGKDSGGANEVYARIVGRIGSPTALDEDGELIIQVVGDGTIVASALFTKAGINNTVIGATLPLAGNFTTLGATGAATVNTLTSAGTIEATAGTFRSGGATVIVATTGAGTFFARPNGSGSAVGELSVNSGGTASFAAPIILRAASASIFSDTADAADTKQINICGGGAAATSRGALLIMYGNENATNPGDLRLLPGVTGDILLDGATFANGNITNNADGFHTNGKTSSNPLTVGASVTSTNGIDATVSADTVMIINRTTNDGTLFQFRQDNVTEGTISSAGVTISYNSFLASHWSQLLDGSKPTILRGTILESIDEMCEWPGELNDRLPKFKISTTMGSSSVYGVFLSWDNDDDRTNDAYVAAVGAGWIRIAAGVVVQRGDCIESNGDGCGRVQSDNIMRASTVGIVSSKTVIETYSDGSYIVPCTLHRG